MKRSTALVLILTLLLALSSCGGGGAGSFKPEAFDFTLRTPTNEMGFENGYTFVNLDDGSVMITEADVSGDVSVPAELAGKKVTAIGDGAFFEMASITSMTLPEGVESIGIYAFSDCTALENISIPSSVWRISPFAFDNTPWLAAQTDEFVTAGDSVLIAYRGDSRTPVLPDSVRHLGGAFAGRDDIRALTLGKGVLSISEMALTYTALRGVDLGLSLVYVGEQAFAGSEYITELVFPDTLRYIGPQALLNCYKINYLYLGRSLTEIGQRAFEYCQNLRTVCIPNTVSALKTSYFTDCFSLCLILWNGTEAEFEAVSSNDAIYSFDRIEKVYEFSGGINE